MVLPVIDGIQSGLNAPELKKSVALKLKMV